jgi:hypothetical protein
MEPTLRPRSICFCGWRNRINLQVFTVAKYKILYWKQIPTQIRVEDDFDDVTVMLDDRFMKLVDEQAMKHGLQDTDAFLAQWNWSEEEEREGPADEVAEALKVEIEAKKW